MHLEEIFLPYISIWSLPRLMQTYTGYTTIYESNDAKVTVLMANLAGTTLVNTHIVFKDNAKEAFIRTFNLSHESISTSSFEIERFALVITN